MCIDGNSATLSVRYLNAQLKALWANAVDCAAHASYTELRSVEYDKSKFTRALREFHLLGRKPPKNLTRDNTDDLFFAATFAEPDLKFICNHEALLCVKIEKGHLNLIHKDCTKPNTRADRSKNHAIEGLEFVFRVPFLRTNVKGRDEKIGNATASHLVQMIVLRLDAAKLMFYQPDKNFTYEIMEAVRVYMKQYFAFLQQAGSHILFDLPDFDIDRYRPHIDYSLIHNDELDLYLRKLDHDVKLLGTVEGSLVSKFYEMLWLTATGLRETKWASQELCLASICSDWIIGSKVNAHFFINFNAPTVDVLCSHEVILTFNIKQLGFFAAAGINEKTFPITEYNGWKISFIVPVVAIKEGEHGILRLDLERAHFSRFHSFFGKDVSQEVSKHIELMQIFFSGDYLDILSNYSLHIVLGIPSGPEVGITYSEDWTETDEGEDQRSSHRKHGQAMLWSERITKTVIYGECDEVVALSETSINRVLEQRHSGIKSWKRDQLFDLDMQAVSVRLLTNGKAIVYVQVEGSVAIRKKTLSTKWWTPFKWEPPTEHDETEDFGFEPITLAYEVDLQLVSHDHVVKRYTLQPVDILQQYYERCCRGTLMELKEWTEYFKLAHLILDYENERFVNELSDVTALTAYGTSDEARDRLATVMAYVPQYLHALVGCGHHILHTVPLCTNWSHFSQTGYDIFAFTDVAFKVLTNVNVDIRTCQREEPENLPSSILMIYGMCGGRALPPFLGTWSPGWVPVGPKAVGTIGISRRLFLQRYILDVLKTVNEATTIVPQYVDVVDGMWSVTLVAWASHQSRKNSRKGCPFSDVIGHSDPDNLKWAWEYADHWTHEHRGNDADEANGEYRLSCATQNILTVPTHYDRGTIKVVMDGKSTVEIGGKLNHAYWSKKVVAQWSLTIKLETIDGRLSTSLHLAEPTWHTEGGQPQGQTSFDILELHKAQLPRKVFEFEMELLPRLKAAMEGEWSYSVMGIQTMTLRDPIFTRRGDLVCELDLAKDHNLVPQAELWVKYSKGRMQRVLTVTEKAVEDEVKITAVEDQPLKLGGQTDYKNGNGNGNGYGLNDVVLAPPVHFDYQAQHPVIQYSTPVAHQDQQVDEHDEDEVDHEEDEDDLGTE